MYIKIYHLKVVRLPILPAGRQVRHLRIFGNANVKETGKFCRRFTDFNWLGLCMSGLPAITSFPEPGCPIRSSHS